MPEQASQQRQAGGNKNPARLAFIAILAMWLILPLAMYGTYGQDALPFMVAGEMAIEGPGGIYPAEAGNLFVLDPEFARRFCETAPAGTDCENTGVAFISTPLTLPLGWVLAQLGPDIGVLAMRLFAAVCLAGGMWSVGERLRSRHPRSDPWLAITALLLTPFVLVPLSLAQNSPILFASTALGISRTERSNAWAALISLVWVLAVAFKAWPVALILMALWLRRWRFLVWSAGWFVMLGLLSIPFARLELIGDFLRASSALNATAPANLYNGSLEALGHAVAPVLDAGPAAVGFLVARVALGGLALWWSRRASPDSRWTYAYLVFLLITPIVWWHYVLLAIAALGVVLADRPHLGREIALLPLAALLSIPISNPAGALLAWPVPQALFLIALAGVVTWLMRDDIKQAHLLDVTMATS